MKKTDAIIFISIAIMALGLFVFTRSTKVDPNRGKYLSVQIDGEEVEQIEISKSIKPMERSYDAYKGRNTFKIENGYVDMIESDCKDQICVHTAPISEVGETIVCLPNRFILEIKEDNRTDNIDVMLR